MSDLKPGDLKLQLIEHFRSPMEEGKVIRPGEVLEICNSDFEKDFGRCLLDLGYRIRPQVPVGLYRIDFVVEGADDRRLAIELDGDNYHGPDRWAEDVRRQKALERLGWVFWRCWGSSWISDRQGCLDDLRATLDRLGIEPLGMAPVKGVYTRHIEVPPPVAEEEFVEEMAVAEPPPPPAAYTGTAAPASACCGSGGAGRDATGSCASACTRAGAGIGSGRRRRGGGRGRRPGDHPL